MVEFLVINVKMVCEQSKRYPEDKGLKLNDISNLLILIYICIVIILLFRRISNNIFKLGNNCIYL